MGCLFCNILEGSVPSTMVYEDDNVYAFEDINPQAPTHVLVIHRKHIKNLGELNDENSRMMAELFLGVKKVASIKGIDTEGYRVIINNGPAAGQVIWHLHLHILGGAPSLGPMLCI